MALVSQKLEYDGLLHNAIYPAMLRRMTGNPDPVPLRVLGDVMKPAGWQPKIESGHYDVFTPLNRLCDAVPPESNTARHFLGLVDTIVSGNPSPKDWNETKTWLKLWRDNDMQLQASLGRSQLTQELTPVSSSLRQVAEIGLETIPYLQSHRSATAKWREQRLAVLKTSQQVQAGLLNMVAPAVAKLVQATAR
jgi:hexosaminidase